MLQIKMSVIVSAVVAETDKDNHSFLPAARMLLTLSSAACCCSDGSIFRRSAISPACRRFHYDHQTCQQVVRIVVVPASNEDRGMKYPAP